MEAFERFPHRQSDQRNRVTFLQIAPVSRSEVPEYAIVSKQVNETIGRVNGRYGEPGWAPSITCRTPIHAPCSRACSGSRASAS